MPLVSVVVFALLSLTATLITMASTDFAYSFNLSASWSDVYSHPWTFLSYMVTHTDIRHWFFNILPLIVFVYALRGEISGFRILLYAVGGGIAGAIAFMSFPQNATCLCGASSAVLSLASLTLIFRIQRSVFPYCAVVSAVVILCVLLFSPSLPHVAGIVAGIVAGMYERHLREESLKGYNLRNSLLKKVSESGFYSLTEEEKRLLASMGNKTAESV